MKTIVLSKNPYLYSTDVIVKELLRRQLEVAVINPLECNVHVNSKESYVLYNGRLLEEVGYVIPRIGSASHFFGIYIVQAFEEKGIPVLNSYQGILNSRDKHNIYQVLLNNNLPAPKCVLVKSSSNLDFIIEQLNGLPVIVKLTRGSQGKGVMIAETMNSLKSIIDTMTLFEEDIILQEYFETTPQYSDVRIYVLDQSVIGATQRINSCDFRSNTHCGGIMKQINVDEDLKVLALKVADCFNLNFCSIDFLLTQSGPKILEINSTPGLEKVETEAQLKLSHLLVNYIEKKLCITNTRI